MVRVRVAPDHWFASLSDSRSKTGERHCHETRHVGETLVERLGRVDVFLERLEQIPVDEGRQDLRGDIRRRTVERARVVRLLHRLC